MFDAIMNRGAPDWQWNPAAQPAAAPWRTWDPNATQTSVGGENGAMDASNSPQGMFNFDPRFLDQFGYTGNTVGDTSAHNQNSQGNSLSPEVSDWLKQNGYSLQMSGTDPAHGNKNLGRLVDAQGNQIGQGQQWGNVNEDAFGLGILAAGGFAGAAAAGVGAAGVGAGTSATGGMSSADLAVLYGNAGYGAGGAGTAGGVGAGTAGGIGADSLTYGALENGAAYGSGAGDSLVASSAGGIPEGALSDVAAGSADKAALYGAEGYGASASPAELAAAGGGAGGGGSGFMSQLGNAASDASSWMKANPMLTNIGGSLINGAIGAYTSGKALDAQTAAAQQANALWAPYNQAGVSAIGGIQKLLANPNSVMQDPGVQFQQQQGQMGIDRSAAARGGLLSGAQLKASSRFNTDYAGTQLDKALSRYSNVAQLGATGTSNMSNNITGLGNAQAGASFYNGNVLQNGVNNALGQFNYSNGGPNPYGQSTYADPRKTYPGP